MSISDTQNFINNKEIVDRIISFVDFQKTKLVIEIGPGKGIITDALIKNAEKIIAIEMDVKLYTTLKQKYIHQNNITLINEDFLKLPLPDREFSIVSNIPFNITANIIRKITEKKSKLSSAYLIVQKEAAIKFIGAPYAHSPLLSNFLKINYQIESLIDIDRRNYSPTPQFDTILLLIKKRDSPVIIEDEQEKFKDFLTYTFQRYKDQLKPALKSIMSNLQIKLMCSNINLDENAELKKITFEDWVKIFNILKSHASPKSHSLILGKYNALLEEQANLKKVNRTRIDR